MARRRHRRNKNYKKFPLDQLPNELITSVLSKMKFESFLKIRISSRWSHDFVEDFRSKIHAQHHSDDMSISPTGISYGWFGDSLIDLPMKELMAIRPKRVTIYGWYQKEVTRELRYWEPNEIKEAINKWRRLGWHKNELKLNDIREDELLIAFDEILKCGVPPSVQISRHLERYSAQITQHSLLSLVPSVSLEGCPSPDFSFILGKQKKIDIRCMDGCPSTINKMIKMALSCSLSIEQVCINFRCPAPRSTMEEILHGLSGTLIWSHETQEDSILKKTIPNIKGIPRQFFYYKFRLADGRVAVLRLYAIENFHLSFWVFPDENELFKEIEKCFWLFFDYD